MSRKQKTAVVMCVTSPDGEIGHFLNGVLLGTEWPAELERSPLLVRYSQEFYENLRRALGLDAIEIVHARFDLDAMPAEFEWDDSPEAWCWSDIENAVALGLVRVPDDDPPETDEKAARTTWCEPTNADRAARVDSLIRRYAREMGEDQGEQEYWLTDLLADLKHWAEQHGVNYSGAEERAEHHWWCERQEEIARIGQELDDD